MEIQWTYEVSINFGKSPLQATSRWQLPTMSRHQAVSELQFFSSIIDTLSSAPDTPISKFLAISDPELDEVWNWNTPLPPDLQTCMHELIAEQAEKQPEKNAIEAWDGNLTYKQIDDYSTHLAQILR